METSHIFNGGEGECFYEVFFLTVVKKRRLKTSLLILSIVSLQSFHPVCSMKREKSLLFVYSVGICSCRTKITENLGGGVFPLFWGGEYR